MEITETRKVHDTRFLKLFERDFEHNGKKATWFFAAREDNPPTHESKKPNAVVIAAVLTRPHLSRRMHQNVLVCTSEFRIPLGARELGFPAGLIDEGETPEDAAVREFKEETGLDFYPTSVSPQNLYSSAGLSNESVQIVFGRANGTPHTENNESLEDIQVKLLTHEDLESVLFNNTDVALSAKAWCLMWGFYHSKMLFI